MSSSPYVAVLQHFGISEDVPLGEGGEARVYGLDDARVLRIYRPGISLELIARRTEFCNRVSSAAIPFATPVIHESAHVDDVHYSIEDRIPGRSLTEALGELAPAERAPVLRDYARTAGLIRTLSYSDGTYGEVLADDPVTRPSWPEYLVARARHNLERGDGHLHADVPDLPDKFDAWAGALDQFIGDMSPCLVHGDYFPGNVMVDDAGRVTGVLDFGPMTVVGDWRLDLVGALVFLDVTPTCRHADSAVVDEELRALCETFNDRLITMYRAYYSFYFCPTRNIAPRLYAWCVRNLQEL